MNEQKQYHTEKVSVEQQLAEIAQATPSLSSELISSNPLAFLLVAELPYGCGIAATLAYEDSTLERSHVYIDQFIVPEPLQRQGIGTRLLNFLVLHARLNAAVSMSGLVTSEAALRTRARVFGKDALHFFERVPLNRRGQQFKRSYEQVLEDLRSNSAEHSVVVEVDLTTISLHDAWQRAAALQSNESIE